MVTTATGNVTTADSLAEAFRTAHPSQLSAFARRVCMPESHVKGWRHRTITCDQAPWIVRAAVGFFGLDAAEVAAQHRRQRLNDQREDDS